MSPSLLRLPFVLASSGVFLRKNNFLKRRAEFFGFLSRKVEWSEGKHHTHYRFLDDEHRLSQKHIRLMRDSKISFHQKKGLRPGDRWWSRFMIRFNLIVWRLFQVFMTLAPEENFFRMKFGMIKFCVEMKCYPIERMSRKFCQSGEASSGSVCDVTSRPP